MEQRKLTDTLESNAKLLRAPEIIILQIVSLKRFEFCRKMEEYEWNFQEKRFVTNRAKLFDTFRFTPLLFFVLNF